VLLYYVFELQSGGLDLWPREFCGLEKKLRVEAYAALDLVGCL
jgi:hypothetical protein